MSAQEGADATPSGAPPVIPGTMAPGSLPGGPGDVHQFWEEMLGQDGDGADIGATYRPAVGAHPPLTASVPDDPQGPPYEILREIGRGGMGVVLEARQQSLHRVVAIKKSLPGAGKPEQQQYLRDSFLSESFANALLDHPNIVPIHDLDRGADGELLLTMKMVRGVSWKSVLHPQTPEDKDRAAGYDLHRHLEILCQACNGIAYAHSKGILHLDLKPENVMLGDYGEVLIMDWGLAHSMSDQPGPIRSRQEFKQPCGSPSYMAPELALGQGHQLGPTTDVYLLGAILHELVTGKPPHAGQGGAYAALAHAATGVPPEYDAAVPQALQEIARRAMAAEPADRYPRVRALRQAIEGYLAHEESNRIAADAASTLSEAQRLRAAGARDQTARNRLYGLFAEAVAGFHQALVLWAGNEEAARQEKLARLTYAETALKRGDLGLAEAQLAELDPADAATASLTEGLKAEKARRHRARRKLKKLRRGLWAAVAAILVGLLVGFILVSGARDDAEEQRDAAQASRQEAETQRDVATRAREAERASRIEAYLQVVRGKASLLEVFFDEIQQAVLLLSIMADEALKAAPPPTAPPRYHSSDIVARLADADSDFARNVYAREPYVIYHLAPGVAPAEVATLLDRLRPLGHAFAHFKTAVAWCLSPYVGHEAGFILGYPGTEKPFPQGYDPRQRPWYQQAAASGRTVWTTPYADKKGQRVVITCAQPILSGSGDRVIAVMAMDITLAAVLEDLFDLSNVDASDAVLVNGITDESDVMVSRTVDESTAEQAGLVTNMKLADYQGGRYLPVFAYLREGLGEGRRSGAYFGEEAECGRSIFTYAVVPVGGQGSADWVYIVETRLKEGE